MQKMVEEGETLYSVGDPVRSVYVVAAGRLRFILGGDGRPAAQARSFAPVTFSAGPRSSAISRGASQR
jgi:hypothetical protein